MKLKERIVRALGYTLNGEGTRTPTPTPRQQAPAKGSDKSKSDFFFESGLGTFLAAGFDAFSAEGDRQGYDDPNEANYTKQIDLLRVQLNNNLQRELFIKENKLSVFTVALESSDNVVSGQIEFKMQAQKAANELKYLNEQIALVDEEKGWYLMLHEALHDGFQDGSKRKMNELKDKYGL